MESKTPHDDRGVLPLYGLINALIVFWINHGEAPGTALGFDPAAREAVRHAYDSYALYASCLLSLLVVIGLGVGGHLLRKCSWRLSRIAARTAAVASFSLLVSLAYIDQLVFEDFGVHVYEFDILDVLRDGVSRQHIGVRDEDLRRIYGVIAGLATVQIVLFATAMRVSRRLPGRMAGISSIAMALGAILGFGFYSYSCRSIARNNYEFFDSLPLGSHFLIDGPRRPFIPTKVRRGPDAYPAVAGPREVPRVSHAKNIVVLLSDGLRADHVSKQAGLTPNIMRFIEEYRPYVARRHFSTSHYTDQGVFGIFYGVDAYHFVPFLQEKVPSYPLEILKRNGYVTAFITHSILNKFPNNGMMDLFDVAMNTSTDDEVIEELARFLAIRRQDSRPYLVFAFVYTPHWPYEFKDSFAVDRPHLGTPYSPEERRLATRNSYRNSVRQADDSFRKVKDLVEEDVRSGKTLFLFTSDHGTEFWEHDAIIGQGKSTFWREKVEVPLLLAGGGSREFLDLPLTSHVDIMPTLLDLLGVEDLPPERYANGISLCSGSGTAERTLVLAGRLFPYANRTNALVDQHGKTWFRATTTSDPGLEFSLFRAMTLDDGPLDLPGDRPPPDFSRKMASFQERFLRFLEFGTP